MLSPGRRRKQSPGNVRIFWVEAEAETGPSLFCLCPLLFPPATWLGKHGKREGLEVKGQILFGLGPVDVFMINFDLLPDGLSDLGEPPAFSGPQSPHL